MSLSLSHFLDLDLADLALADLAVEDATVDDALELVVVALRLLGTYPGCPGSKRPCNGSNPDPGRKRGRRTTRSVRGKPNALYATPLDALLDTADARRLLLLLAFMLAFMRSFMFNGSKSGPGRW